MSRDDHAPAYPGFPGAGPDAHVRTIPACAALGMRQHATLGQPVYATLNAAVSAVRDADGRIDRGAALVLADQATAGGVFASMAQPMPMMTLDLRVDWFAALPMGVLACRIDDVTREGDLAFVRARLSSDGAPVGAVTARYLVGAMPGGEPGMDRRTELLPPSDAGSFAAYLDAQLSNEGLTMVPRADHVGGPLPAFHGGVIAALLEASAIRTLDPALRPLDVETRFLAPARADRPLVTIVTPRRLGRRAATIDVAAHQGDPAKPVAIARMLAIADVPGKAQAVELPRGDAFLHRSP